MAISRVDSAVKASREAEKIETAEQVLTEIYELLENYAPAWYSEQLRERVQSVLKRSRYARV